MRDQSEHRDGDAIIVGGGVAGLSAALMLGRARRRVIVIDAGEPRNRYADAVHAVLGHEGISPTELLARGRRELERYDVEVRAGRVTSASSDGAGATVTLDGGEQLTARALVLASGIVDELPTIAGLDALWGDRVLHCPYCHGWEVAGRPLGVLAVGPAALHQAELVRQWSDDVTLFTNGVSFDTDARARLEARSVAIVGAPVTAVHSDDDAHHRGIIVETADGERVHRAALFTAGAPRLDSALVTDLALELDVTLGGVRVDQMNATSAPRVWAAGNVVAPYASVPIAMASGTQAGASVNAALVADDTDRAVAAASDPARFWDERYRATERSWSGHANRAVVDVVAPLAPARALELGCGEGADARWLAEQGWHVTALDISPTAIERTRALAAASETMASAGGRVDARVADLARDWPVDGLYELVVASYLQSPVALDRTEILRRASGHVAPGGRLLLVTHAAPPPWAPAEHRAHFAGVRPADDHAALGLDPTAWAIEILEERPRAVTGPRGEAAQLLDGILLVRRIAS